MTSKALGCRMGTGIFLLLPSPVNGDGIRFCKLRLLTFDGDFRSILTPFSRKYLEVSTLIRASPTFSLQGRRRNCSMGG